MATFVTRLFFVLVIALFGQTSVHAQESEPVGDEDGSSEQVESRDDSYRRQMELEDARARDRTYVDSSYGRPADLEKIDKLPEESRDNIRDQLIDVIMKNGEWEPSDVLEEYPYVPTSAAQSDPELMEREQEAWEEQVEKYHAREAAAFGTHRGPVPGPGNPTGKQGGGQDGGGEGQGGGSGAGGGDGGDGSEGTYEPYQSGSPRPEGGISTEGVSENALEFLRGSQGRQQSPGQDAQARAAQAAAAQQDSPADSPESARTGQAADQAGEQDRAAQQQESDPEFPLDLRGIIPIEDLDKLEGTEVPVATEEEKDG